MNWVLRGDGAVEDFDGISLPKMRGLLVLTMMMISPSEREVPLVESLRWRAKVLLPKFRLETASLHPESPLPIFF